MPSECRVGPLPQEPSCIRIASTRPKSDTWSDHEVLNAEMTMQDFGVGLNFLRGAFVHDMAVIEDVDALCQRQRGGEILLNQHDSLSGGREIATHRYQVAHDH